jgi:hypothetical protein
MYDQGADQAGDRRMGERRPRFQFRFSLRTLLILLKYLRIAVTALSLTACVLLIALWMRSFWVTDLVSRIDSQKIATTIGSQYGTVYFAHFDAEIAYARR